MNVSSSKVCSSTRLRHLDPPLSCHIGSMSLWVFSIYRWYRHTYINYIHKVYIWYQHNLLIYLEVAIKYSYILRTACVSDYLYTYIYMVSWIMMFMAFVRPSIDIINILWSMRRNIVNDYRIPPPRHLMLRQRSQTDHHLWCRLYTVHSINGTCWCTCILAVSFRKLHVSFQVQCTWFSCNCLISNTITIHLVNLTY